MRGHSRHTAGYRAAHRPGVSELTHAQIYRPLRIGTTLPRPLAAGVLQYNAYSAISRRRFSNRSPRRALHLVKRPHVLNRDHRLLGESGRELAERPEPTFRDAPVQLQSET
jgi:hypothetical protein